MRTVSPLAEQMNGKLLGWLALGILAWLLATLPLLMAVGLVGATTGAFLLLRWPWLLWIGVAVVLPVSSGIKFGPLSATEVGVATGAALWFVDGVRRRTLRLTMSPEVIALFVYVGALLLALVEAQNLGEAVAEVIKWGEVAVVILLVRQMLPPPKRPWLVVAAQTEVAPVATVCGAVHVLPPLLEEIKPTLSAVLPWL